MICGLVLSQDRSRMHSLRTAAERRDERLSCRIFRQFRHDEAVWRAKKYDAMSAGASFTNNQKID